MLDGKWELDLGSGTRQYPFNTTNRPYFEIEEILKKNKKNTLKAKQHCSNEGKCFGIAVEAISGYVYYINFPIRLIQQQQVNLITTYIHKKENVPGNIVYHECLFILEDK